MEEQVQKLVQKTWENYQNTPPNERLLIAISGIPGSGKTTLAITMTQRLNSLHELQNAKEGKEIPPSPAAYIPMDGYHFSRKQLHEMPDPKLAHDRRGAVWTFDGDAFLKLVQLTRLPLTPSTPTIYAPSFSHTLKDPIPNDIPIPPFSRILIFEGNYLSLNVSPWLDASKLMNYLWFVEVDFEIAGRRLVDRHVKAGIARNEEEAWRRVRENDLVNGREIVEGRVEGVHEVVLTVEEKAWGEIV